MLLHDAVDVDVADVALFRQARLHLEQRLLEDLVRFGPEHRRAHLAGRGAAVSGEELLVLEIGVDRVDEALAVEESAHGDLDADDALLELEDLDLVGEGLLVGLEHPDDVAAVLLVADEEAPFHVARRARRLDDVARRVLGHVGDGVVEVVEVPVRDDRDAGLLQLLLAERAVVLQPVGVGRAAHDGLSLRPHRHGLLALPERVVEDDHVRPVHVLLPVVGLRDETVGDVLFLGVADEVADLVAFLQDLPRDVADEAGQRHEEELALLLHRGGGILHAGGEDRIRTRCEKPIAKRGSPGGRPARAAGFEPCGAPRGGRASPRPPGPPRPGRP